MEAAKIEIEIFGSLNLNILTEMTLYVYYKCGSGYGGGEG